MVRFIAILAHREHSTVNFSVLLIVTSVCANFAVTHDHARQIFLLCTCCTTMDTRTRSQHRVTLHPTMSSGADTFDTIRPFTTMPYPYYSSSSKLFNYELEITQNAEFSLEFLLKLNHKSYYKHAKLPSIQSARLLECQKKLSRLSSIKRYRNLTYNNFCCSALLNE